MRKKILLALLLIFVYPLVHYAQVQNVIVETYYISDANDATDLDGAGGIPGLNLPVGSRTYRIYVELEPGSRLIGIYGDALHTLKIKSTQSFFNNRDRGKSFGKDIDNTKLKSNTVALDTWLTLGKATKKHHGVLKTKDINGTILHPGNDGGSGGITGGLLLNAAAEAGIPLSQQDGLIHDTLVIDTAMAGQWTANGFTDLLGNDTTMFGQDSVRSEFISNDALLRLNSGVTGPLSYSENVILVAQLTTAGELSFELNIEIEEYDGSVATTVKYVAALAPGEVASETLHVSPYLTYPPVCGCTDPNYLEYNVAYACNISDSCQTRIVFGCMDPMACNYKADANFNIPELCCYPGYCNDRDIAVVCPVLNTKRMQLYPNPVRDAVTLQISSDISEETKYEVYDALGRMLLEENISVSAGTSTIKIDVSALSKGVYMFRLHSGENSESKMFLKD